MLKLRSMSRSRSLHSPTFSPLYRQIKNLILRDLEVGEWGPGDSIPSESELAGRGGVSQGTLRQAVGEIASIGGGALFDVILELALLANTGVFGEQAEQTADQKVGNGLRRRLGRHVFLRWGHVRPRA